jgi:hypothetical protein
VDSGREQWAQIGKAALPTAANIYKILFLKLFLWNVAGSLTVHADRFARRATTGDNGYLATRILGVIACHWRRVVANFLSMGAASL